MSDFDSLCDPSAPGNTVSADALWEAVMTTAQASRGGSAYVPPEPEPVCQYCEGGGWESYGIGRGDPHFRDCSNCHNPEGLPSP